MSNSAATADTAGSHIPKSSFGVLMLAAIGVVFGDIGTSPLYAMKETFHGPHPLPIDKLHVLGVLSLIFWSITMVVSIKYVIFIMRADNRGEGGSLALLALLGRITHDKPKMGFWVATLGIFAASLFYGDSMITPAISVLSAVEGLQVVAPKLSYAVEPITIAILVGLFMIQSHGTAVVGKLFGPVMTAWFAVLLFLGVRNIGQAPGVLAAVSPHYALWFIWEEGLSAFLAFGSVVLAVTGAEALYADMGHFGRWPIRLAWYFLVLPALVLNYFGQGALLLTHPEAVENPLFLMAPGWAGVPLLILATCATVIASQAVISGAFSVTQQAIQLGYLPRMKIVHTSEKEAGQIYIPFVNYGLMTFVIALVLGFHSSSNLASAYGVAVTGDMVITTILFGLVMRFLWGWRKKRMILLVGTFLTIDLTFFLANSPKIPHGGWFPLAIAVVLFVFLTTWKRGRALLLRKLEKDAMPIDDFLASLSERVVRVKGTAIFLTGQTAGVPLALLHNLKHNQVLHERVVLLTVRVDERPYVSPEHRIEAEALPGNFHRVIIHFGYMEDPNLPKALANARTEALGFFYEPMAISYFLSRETIIASAEPGMAIWRERLFAWMSRSSTTAMDFFCLPVTRVVELGGQVEI